MADQDQVSKSSTRLTGRVTVAEHKFAVFADELFRSDDGLVLELRETFIEPSGAITAVDPFWVRDVIFVILTTIHLAVPATRELQLKADAIVAVCVNPRLLGQVMAIQSWLFFFWPAAEAVIQAVESNRKLLTFIVGLVGVGALEAAFVRVGTRKGGVSPQVVAGNHLEAVGEGLNRLVLSVRRFACIELIVTVKTVSAKAILCFDRKKQAEFVTYALKGGFSGTMVRVPSSPSK